MEAGYCSNPTFDFFLKCLQYFITKQVHSTLNLEAIIRGGILYKQFCRERWNSHRWSLSIRRLQKFLLSCLSRVWVAHFYFALSSCTGSTVVVNRLRLVPVLVCQGGNVQNVLCVLVVAGRLVEYVVVELREQGGWLGRGRVIPLNNWMQFFFTFTG